MPIGSIIAWDNTADIPSDYLICNGSIFDAAVYPELKNILGSNKLPNMNTSLKANIDGYYATGYQNYRSNAHGNPVRTWEWGHKGQYNVSLTQHRLHFNSFQDGMNFSWNIKWIIKAK